MDEVLVTCQKVGVSIVGFGETDQLTYVHPICRHARNIAVKMNVCLILLIEFAQGWRKIVLFFFRFLGKTWRRVVQTLPSRRSCRHGGEQSRVHRIVGSLAIGLRHVRTTGTSTQRILWGTRSLREGLLSLSLSPSLSLSLSLSFFPSLLLNGWSGGVQPGAVNLVLWRHWCMQFRCIQWRRRTNFTAPGCMQLTRLTLVCEQRRSATALNQKKGT